MSQTTITLAFEQWKAQQGTTGEPVLLDEFVFANVPGLDPDQPVDRNETLPPAEQIVHRQAVSRKGVVNDNAVVHSVVLGADVGDFSFNWIGLINKASGTLAMIVHAPLQQKLKTAEGQQGNVLTRSFLMEYNGAQAETGINTPAETGRLTLPRVWPEWTSASARKISTSSGRRRFWGRLSGREKRESVLCDQRYRLCGWAAYNACSKPEYYRDNRAGQSLAGCMLDRNAYQRVGCAVPYYGC